MKRLMVPLDGSNLAQHAVVVAEAIAQRNGGEIVLMHAHWPGVPKDSGDNALSETLARLQARGTRVEAEVRPTPRDEETGRVIVETARDQNADAVVMATHGRGGLGRWLFGSTAEQVLRSAEIPVILVPPSTHEDWPTGHEARVLLALDQSTPSERAIEPAMELARGLDAEVVVVQVIARARHDDAREAHEAVTAQEYIDRIASRVREAGLAARGVVVHGHPDRALSALAGELNASAVALGTRGSGRTDANKDSLGSVALGLIRRIDVPVLLACDPA